MTREEENEEVDELRSEYDFSETPGGVRGKYAEAYRGGTNLARLDPDVAEAFDTDAAVNEALRAILRVAPERPTKRAGREDAPPHGR